MKLGLYLKCLLICLVIVCACEKTDNGQIPAVQSGKSILRVISADIEYVYDYDNDGRLISITENYRLSGMSSKHEFDSSEEGILVVTGKNYTRIYTFGDCGEMLKAELKWSDMDYLTLHFIHSHSLPIKCLECEDLRDEYTWEDGNLISRTVFNSIRYNFSYTPILNNWHVPLPIFHDFSGVCEYDIYPLMLSRNLPSEINDRSYTYERNSDGDICKVICVCGNNILKEYTIEYR